MSKRNKGSRKQIRAQRKEQRKTRKTSRKVGRAERWKKTVGGIKGFVSGIVKDVKDTAVAYFGKNSQENDIPGNSGSGGTSPGYSFLDQVQQSIDQAQEKANNLLKPHQEEKWYQKTANVVAAVIGGVIVIVLSVFGFRRKKSRNSF